MLQQLQTLASDDIQYMAFRLVHYWNFSENRCMNGCNVLFSEYRVEDCLELYIDYQPLAHLSYSSYVAGDA